MRYVRLTGFAVLAAAVAAAAGCGGSQTPAKIKGVVSYKGSPVPGGTITFATDGGRYSSSIGPDGSYTVTDAPTGTAGVIIETETVNPESGTPDEKKLSKAQAKYVKGEGMSKKMREEFEGPKGGGGGGGGGFGPASREELAKLYVKIPAKYADKRTSGLTLDITRGEQTKNFELTD